MQDYHLLIVDANPTYTNYLCDQFSLNSPFRHIASANDGLNALEKAQTFKPNMVLMDPLLTGMDGLSLLKMLKSEKNAPTVVCMSEFYSSLSLEAIRLNGADYFVYKPIETNALMTVLTECAERARARLHQENLCLRIDEADRLNEKTYSILRELGFSTKHSGSRYIAQSIQLARESPLCMRNLTTGIYLKLSERNHIPCTRIERCMRTAIAAANADGSLTRILGRNPTNKSCIQHILHRVNSLD